MHGNARKNSTFVFMNKQQNIFVALYKLLNIKHTMEFSNKEQDITNIQTPFIAKFSKNFVVTQYVTSDNISFFIYG
jgi:hypothetical protein